MAMDGWQIPGPHFDDGALLVGHWIMVKVRTSLARRRPPAPPLPPALCSCATRRSAHGARCAQDVGAGRVVGFTRAMIGASSHVLQLEHEGQVRQVSVKLRRKNNGETEWYIKPDGYRHVAPGSAAIAGAQPAQSPAAAAAAAPATAARAEATHSSAAMEQASELALAQRRRPHSCAGTIQLVKVHIPCWTFSAFFQNIGSFHILSGVKNPAPMFFSCSRYSMQTGC